MAMASFLHRMIWKGEDNDYRQNATTSEPKCLAGEKENKKLVAAVSDWFENRSQSASNIPEVTARPRRPSSLRLFGSSKKLMSDVSSGQSSDLQGSKVSAARLVEDVVKEFEDNYKSPTRTPSKKSKNFVRKLVAALERKHRENEVDESYATRNSSGPIYAYDKFGSVKKSETNRTGENQADDQANNVADKTNGNSKAQGATAVKTAPKIIGAFLKKPVEVEETSIYWIPITADKKLPRKKSLKKLLARLRGRNGGEKGEKKTKQVVFASQNNLVEEIHDSGYEGRSTSSRTSSLTSFTETLMYRDEDYVDKAYRDCNFSTFVTSSPLKKQQPVKRSEDLPEPRVEEKLSPEVVEMREDSGYITNHSILEESIPKQNLVATRVQQISYQLAKLPKHPFARSEPRLYPQNNDELQPCGEIITLRKRRDEPIYDVPQSRPRSSIFDESLSMKRRNLPIQTVAPFACSEIPVFSNLGHDEQPHYATVKPRNNRTRFSYDNLCQTASETVEKSVEESVNPKKYLHSSYADLTANGSFVISMYV